MKRGFPILLLVGVLASSASVSALAINYPNKAVHFVVPFAPGGATDVVARQLGNRLSKMWKQPVIIENKPGAGGNIGAAAVAGAPADGYTVLIASPAEVAINPHLYAQMPFDPKDLKPVSKLASSPLVLVVHPSVPAKTVPELVAHIQAQKGSINYASSGAGGPQHLAGEQFKIMTKTIMTHVPYKGGAAATIDLLGGQVQMFFSGLPPALPHIKAGKLRALAVTTAERSTLVPLLPTLAESGLPGFDVENWQGAFVQSGTSKEIVEQLARDIAKVVSEDDFKETLTAQGATPSFMSPAIFAAFVDSESKKYAQLIKASGAKAE